MGAIEFDETELSNLEEIGKKLFADEHDPRSVAYQRILKRPPIRWLRVSLYIAAPIVISVLMGLIMGYCHAPKVLCGVGIGIFLLVYILVTLKKAVIGAVKIYQHFAPASLRNKCRFEPSCSEYMILSIEKYGLIKGLKKGCGRLKRCNIHHGGYDYP